MDERGAIDAELYTPTLDVAHGAAHVKGDRARSWVGHQTARTQDAAETADLAHHVGRGHGDVEVEPAALDLLNKILCAHVIGAGVLGLARLIALRKDQHAHGTAGTVRQHGGAAHHLIGMTWVNAKVHVHLHRPIKRAVADLL